MKEPFWLPEKYEVSDCGQSSFQKLVPLFSGCISCVCIVTWFYQMVFSVRESFQTQNTTREKVSMNIIYGQRFPWEQIQVLHCKTLIFLHRWSLHVMASAWDTILEWSLTSDAPGQGRMYLSVKWSASPYDLIVPRRALALFRREPEFWKHSVSEAVESMLLSPHYPTEYAYF